MRLRALDAQAALLPYALPVFLLGLALLTWVMLAGGRPGMALSALAVFAINCLVDYSAIRWLRKHPEKRDNITLRTRIHVIGGLLWACAVAQLAIASLHAGPLAEPMLMLAIGAAAACIFFASPLLLTLLIVAPAAIAGPLVVLQLGPFNKDTPSTAWGGLALAMALALIVNRILRRQFALAEDRERLMAESAASLLKAERLSKSKSDLVSTLSHEIRDGLTGVVHVLAAASGAAGRAAPSREQMSAALDAARDLIEVLNTTLDSETAEAGRLTVTNRPFDPARLLEELVLLNRPAAVGKGLELSVHIEDGLKTGAAVADPTRTRQIIANLIGNAVKYTVRGRVEVRLRRQGDHVVRFEIADTGPGLSAQELALAFEPFERVDRTAAGLPGAGLGLSLSRRLARMMEGEVEAHSAPGVGSCFWFDCPYDASTSAAEEQPAPTPDMLDLVEPPQGLRVLLADDDALDAVMVRAALEQLGHQVVQAHDARRALSLAALCDFDLIVLDGGLPNQGAARLARALRGNGGVNADAPMIALIDGDADEARNCQDAGMDATLRKPLTVASAARAISEALAARKAKIALKAA